MKKDHKPSYLTFNRDSYFWKPDIDYKAFPEKYKVGKGEQGVLICQPYKIELVPHWRFKTPEVAQESSEKIYQMFQDYLKQGDFVGADMARKFLQMGFTRARRYTNFKGGKKYDATNDYKQLPKGTGDPIKAQSAEIFYQLWKKAEADPEYSARKAEWKKLYG